MNATMKAALARHKCRIEPTHENAQASRIASHLAEVERRLRQPRAAASRGRESMQPKRPPLPAAKQFGPGALQALVGRVIGHVSFTKRGPR